ncbi:hypothetical protein [uncultured Duncaniella sp.]|uniref:hypothetical protein n=1 Tax=uncultured Duncaniella sp. TaxID=2768039 RepID=UPI0026F3E269|nr:hypothetical protein [uncultured Duncaniella sp.]
MAINKVIYGGNTLIDLTGDSVTKDKLLAGYTAHDKSGEVIEGTCLFDVDSTDATATAAEILNGQTAYARGNKVSGTMKNNGAVSEEITDKDSVYTIPIGYHDGSGTVQLDATERAKLIPGNIKKGVNVLGVEGDCEPSSDVTAQAKTATPSTVKQTILPDDGVDYLSQVVIDPIAYVECANSAGGVQR